MKKRRELNALVGHAKSKRSTKKDRFKVDSELLRNESDSSDESNEFTSQNSKSALKKSGFSLTCTSCVTAFSFFLIILCIVSCGALVWVHLELKREFDEVRNHLTSVEHQNEKSESQYNRLRDDFANKTQSLQAVVELCKKDLLTARKNYTKVTKQIKVLVEQSRTTNSVPLLKGLAALGSELSEKKTKDEAWEKKQTEKLNTLEIRIKNVEEKLYRVGGGADHREQQNLNVDDSLRSLKRTHAESLDRVNRTLLEKTETLMKAVNSLKVMYNDLRSTTTNLTTKLADLAHSVEKPQNRSTVDIVHLRNELVDGLTPAITHLIIKMQKSSSGSNNVTYSLQRRVSAIEGDIKILNETIRCVKQDLHSMNITVNHNAQIYVYKPHTAQVTVGETLHTNTSTIATHTNNGTDKLTSQESVERTTQTTKNAKKQTTKDAKKQTTKDAKKKDSFKNLFDSDNPT